MGSSKTKFISASRLGRAGGVLLRSLLVAALLSCFGYTAWAKKPKSKKTAHAKISKKHVSPDVAQLSPANYPPEISSRVAAYNAQAREINALRNKDPRMAKARGEVLEIQRQSFELYASFMSCESGREAGKIRQAVAVNGWYKGMPQIAFVVSMGLPDDIESPSKQDGRLKLVYKSSTFYFEKGRLREYEAARQ
jgi:hypothetical protein